MNCLCRGLVAAGRSVLRQLTYLRSPMKFLQINANRSRQAHDVAYSRAISEGFDIIIASEPNKRLCAGSRWLTDENSDVAACLINRNIQVKWVRKRNGVVGIQLQDFAIFGCYISPNVGIERFEAYVDGLIQFISENNGESLVLGDFNAKSHEWGSPLEDRRGQVLLEGVANIGLAPQNVGQIPTFERGTSASYIDITFCSQRIAARLRDWQVSRCESLSPYNHISFEIGDSESRAARNTLRDKISLDKDIFRNSIIEESIIDSNDRESYETLMEMLAEATKKATRGRKDNEGVRAPYWWTLEIQARMNQCNCVRRMYLKLAARRNAVEEATEMWGIYKEIRKKLRSEIKAEKRRC